MSWNPVRRGIVTPALDPVGRGFIVTVELDPIPPDGWMFSPDSLPNRIPGAIHQMFEDQGTAIVFSAFDEREINERLGTLNEVLAASNTLYEKHVLPRIEAHEAAEARDEAELADLQSRLNRR